MNPPHRHQNIRRILPQRSWGQRTDVSEKCEVRREQDEWVKNLTSETILRRERGWRKQTPRVSVDMTTKHQHDNKMHLQVEKVLTYCRPYHPSRTSLFGILFLIVIIVVRVPTFTPGMGTVDICTEETVRLLPLVCVCLFFQWERGVVWWFLFGTKKTIMTPIFDQTTKTTRKNSP